MKKASEMKREALKDNNIGKLTKQIIIKLKFDQSKDVKNVTSFV